MQGSNRAYGWRMTQAYPTQSAPPTPLPAGVLLTPKIIADKQHGQHGEQLNERARPAQPPAQPAAQPTCAA